MFDFSFAEFLVIATVGLIVIGPERLPEATRFVLRYVKHARQCVGEVHAHIRREMRVEDAKGLEDMKSIHRDLTKMGRDAEAAFRSAAIGMSEGAQSIQAEVTGKGESLKPERKSESAAEEKPPSSPSTS